MNYNYVNQSTCTCSSNVLCDFCFPFHILMIQRKEVEIKKPKVAFLLSAQHLGIDIAPLTEKCLVLLYCLIFYKIWQIKYFFLCSKLCRESPPRLHSINEGTFCRVKQRRLCDWRQPLVFSFRANNQNMYNFIQKYCS